jgi:regulator of nucleoside diphosphate kinase
MDTPVRAAILPEPDMRRLLEIAEGVHGPTRDRDGLERLASALEQARVVSPDELPADVVSMHSAVRVRDVETGEEATYTLVYPASADASARKLSVLAPIGLALLGRREGEEVTPTTPGGARRLRIVRLEHQPERTMAAMVGATASRGRSDAPVRRLA